MNIRVADIQACYELWRSRGAEFISVQEGLRLREGTNECVDRETLSTPGISYDDLKNERNRRSIMPNFDAIPSLAQDSAGPAVGAAIGSCRPEGRDHRTQAVRRHLREHRLYSDQDANRECLRGTCFTSRRRLRHQDRGAGQCRHEGNGRGAFTHTSWNDFEIVAANLLDNDQRRVSDRITAYALYTDPPLGRAGMTEAEVRKTDKPALISTMAMKDVMRAYERGETKGFMKILVDRDSKQILGASFLGIEGDEVIHCVLDIMYAKAPGARCTFIPRCRSLFRR